jgi:hypothetical protein
MLQTRLIPSYKKMLKGTVAPVWVWLKVVWLERAKTGEEPKNFLQPFDF